MVEVEARVLGDGDAELVERFLVKHRESSMFLRSNARAVGLSYSGAIFSARWVGAVGGDGELVGVAAHCWNDMLLLQAPEAVEVLARATVASSARKVAGIIGPLHQVYAARAALGLDDAPVAHSAPETLYALSLGGLRVPAPLASGALVVSPARPEHLELLARWRLAYNIEALGDEPDGHAQAEAARQEIAGAIERGDAFTLTRAEAPDVPLAYAQFNGRLPDIVQIGGVWTPPAERGRGYGRAVTAGTLLAARAAGAVDAVLFTDTAAAIRAYSALGFRAIGTYGLLLFAEPQEVRARP